MSKNPEDATKLKAAKRIRALEKKVARFETLQDIYETRWQELESLLQCVGFEHGVASLRQAAEELLLCEMDNE